MSSKAKLRSRRALHDLPPIATDEELLAWSEELVAPAVAARGPREPVIAEPAPVVPLPPAPAEVATPASDRSGGPQLTDEELFAEIYERALAASART